jgi:hypothetical protein
MLNTHKGGTPELPNLFDRITDTENINKAYNKALRGRNRYSREAMEFTLNETHNLNELRDELLNGSYEFSGYNRFTVMEPKERVIDAPHFKDKVVQLAINNEIKEIYQPCFIHDSYASIDNKGTHKCVDRLQYFLRKAKWQYGNDAFILKLDIKKFFYSIDRDIMKRIYSKKIGCRKTLNLLNKIIDSAAQISDKGMPLGNTLSQISANVYMNELDQYAKRKLGIKYYIRYMDDVVAILPSKSDAKETLDKLTAFVNTKLNLATNTKKTKIFPLRQGVNVVGFKMHPTHKLLRDSSKRKIKRKARKMKRLLHTGIMSTNKAEQILNSWLGHAKHGSSYNFICRLLHKNDHIYLSGGGVLKVNILQGEGD